MEITSSGQFRPELDDEKYFTNTMPSRNLAVQSYVYNESGSAYAGYPRTNLGDAEFVYRTKGGENATVRADKLFKDGEYYFNMELDKDGKKQTAGEKPVLDDGILMIHAVKIDKTNESNVLLEIDLKNGKVVKNEPLRITQEEKV